MTTKIVRHPAKHVHPPAARSSAKSKAPRRPPTIEEVLRVIRECEVDLEGLFGGLLSLLPPLPTMVVCRLDERQRTTVAVDLLVRSLPDIRVSLGALRERLEHSGAVIRAGKAVA